MGCQLAVCVPDKDMILIYNGDNQGKEDVCQCIIDDFMKLIVNTSSEEPIEEMAIHRPKATTKSHSWGSAGSIVGERRNNTITAMLM
jgi:hypothetical protein